MAPAAVTVVGTGLVFDPLDELPARFFDRQAGHPLQPLPLLHMITMLP